MKPKPCPWCGHEPSVEQVKPEGRRAWEVMCRKGSVCPVNAFCFGATREQAVSRWNERKGQ